MRSSLARCAATATLAAATLAARPAAAQMVGLPAVQAPFPGRSFAVALDGGSASDGQRTAGVAIAARAGASRLTGALGLGVVQGFARSHPSIGLRVAYLLPFGTTGAIGVAPFAGAGSVSRGKDADAVPVTGGRPPLPGSLTVAPAGVALGYRRLVAGRAVALHVAPQVQLWRVGRSTGVDATTAYFGRVAVGADVAVTRQLGLALAYETGGSTARLADGPRRRVFGVGVSYTPRRGRR